MKILRIKQPDGTTTDVPLGKGIDGKSAYEYAQESGYTGTAAEFSAILANAVDKRKITLGLYTDGLIYLFIDGLPVGNGIALPSGGVSGDIVGNVDSANNIVLMGNLADGSYSVKYEMEDGKTVNIGNLVLDSNVYYSVTKNLTNCTISNGATSVIKGESYSATITANDGYELSSVVVTMGGANVSVTNGVIYIASVTGNIVVTAVAEVSKPKEPITENITLTDGIRVGSDGGDRTQAGYCATPHIDLTDIPKPCTIHLTKAKWLVFDGESNTMIRVYAKKANGTQLISEVAKEGIGGSYFTIVDNSDIGNDVIVTITSNDVGYIRFSGHWTYAGVSDSDVSFVAANTKATLTYTPK